MHCYRKGMFLMPINCCKRRFAKEQDNLPEDNGLDIPWCSTKYTQVKWPQQHPMCWVRDGKIIPCLKCPNHISNKCLKNVPETELGLLQLPDQELFLKSGYMKNSWPVSLGITKALWG